ncbi:transcription elongation factor GreA [candidate division CPR3 bacterium GWF2_35_18]|uniref:Transcription elongation factor GreA n=1 Tax=candidate division CPR3 bacterium GW2011_GWF2_35_18 TaxID=1618350 RepID=A0A0G0BLJ0_UNCC3|nr:MAG: Transcription elongation factor GreA [candidate division CPR3 bacterium GW2011_GWF2_35_18]KKP85418.1 MAG: Transcription elongation factor GreA [candidate division CPR3 bacterium GW2011_GWE2_35_7]OGB63578.1 MAG: transcription elongation factor GreA [candidate division CPR3 bacterium GWF2_35_18]OGB64687.1 MAG: transcription elongation factor GreA [candidate division CPR3 bacterium RIFOXYA2_FULL_35_13]OGB79081.1 MAG: transcription elongation factor GreA [candidate division CPR3 bacterium R
MNQQNDVFVTKEGLEKLKKEYEELTNVKRKEVVKKLTAARELGDLSENSAWQTAREEQSFIEGRIEELEEILRNAKVIAVKNHNGVVILGSKVKLHIDGTEEEFHIVGAPEADPKKQKISHESPLGKALLGKKIGDTVEIDAPLGRIKYRIIAIS